MATPIVAPTPAGTRRACGSRPELVIAVERRNPDDAANTRVRHEGLVGMGIAAFALIGVVVGVFMRALMPHDDPGGVLFTAVIGLFGGLAGGVFVALIVGMDPTVQFFDLLAWVGALAGAVVILTFYKLISTQG
ncbi:MAG: hypothetical protein WD080_09660 [Egibacteraceae bacterium]